VKKEFNNIEDIFKDAFDGFEANVDPSVWTNVQQNINIGGNGVSPSNPTNIVAGSSKMALTKLVAGIALATAVVTSSYYLFVADEDRNATEQVIENNTTINNQESVVETEETTENASNSAVDTQAPQSKNDVSDKVEAKSIVSATDKQATNVATTITNTNTPVDVVSNYSTQTNVSSSSTQPKTTQKSTVEAVDFNFKIKANTTKGKAPLDVEFSLDGEAAGYIWDFGDDTPSSNLANPFHTFSEPGKYKVKLTAIDKNANAKTVVQVITVEKNIISKLAPVPTVFSPNGDGMNDVIKIEGENIAQFNAVVRDVKGNIVFEWNTIEGFWDGRDNNNQLMPKGTYYIVVAAVGTDGEKYSVKQAIQLFQ
jgi:gliding motility-associated-like protein